MALFFVAAGFVFLWAWVFGGRTKPKGTFNPEGKIKPDKEPVSPWPPLMALGLILLLALIFAIYNGLMLAQLARNKDEIPQIIMWLSWLREHQANELIGGALAGVIGVVGWVIGTAFYLPKSFGFELAQRWGLTVAAVLAVLLAVFSIGGDLFESLLKRRASMKDSSNLLPGHGGVYDRIDAVVAVVPLAYLLLGNLPW